MYIHIYICEELNTHMNTGGSLIGEHQRPTPLFNYVYTCFRLSVATSCCSPRAVKNINL